MSFQVIKRSEAGQLLLLRDPPKLQSLGVSDHLVPPEAPGSRPNEAVVYVHVGVLCHGGVSPLHFGAQVCSSLNR